jgi:hypothetical protein
MRAVDGTRTRASPPRPAPSAWDTKRCPSVVSPLSATNRSPGPTSRLSKATPETAKSAEAVPPVAAAIWRRSRGSSDPPRHGEGDRPQDGGGGVGRARRVKRAPSTMLRMVPLPVPGRMLSPRIRVPPEHRRTAAPRSPTICPCSCPLPASSTISSAPASAMAAAIALRRSPISIAPGAPASTSRRIAAGSSLRGLSSVTIT